MNPGRIIGIVLGVVILVAAFILPFGFYGDTFFNLARFNMENLGLIQETENQR